jgi:hypothetical protein
VLIKIKESPLKGIPKCHNRFEFVDGYVIGYTNKNEKFFIDTEDYEKIKDTYWSYNYHHYLRNLRGELMHRVVMGVTEPDISVDHINHIEWDNRKENLRLCSHDENMFNRIKKSNNTSGVIGVNYEKDSNKWRARLWIKGKLMFSKRFNNFDDAVKARKDAEKKYFGEFAYNPDAPRIEVS